MSESESESESIVLPGVALHLDVRHFPVLVVTWFGVLTPELVLRYSDWLGEMGTRATAEGTKLVILDDTTGAESLPGPEVRRAMARAMEDLSTNIPGILLGASAVVTNPFMRAVARIVLSISRRKYDIRPVKNIDQAIDAVLAMLDEAGVPRPEGLDAKTYRRPARPR